MTNPQDAQIIDGIAIIGMAGRFPGANTIDEFWQNLKNGVESISFFSEKDLIEAGVESELVQDPNYVKAKGILEDIQGFDAAFFGFNAREAEITDPQQRLFLECAWQGLEESGYNPDSYNGTIGVYGGVGKNSYLLHNLMSRPDIREKAGDYQMMIANEKDFLPTRVSYKLNLKGPSVTIQTACSTSLVATAVACQNLLTYQCDMAIAGGVSIPLPQREGYLYQEGMILSPDGHCRAFDAEAKGTVSGSGVGIVVLKRLDEAIADGDYIHAVIRGSAINNDGALKVGYTAPSVEGQAEAIAQAQALAEVDPETITYIETHGTGTPLGDPIEIAALTQVFSLQTNQKHFCAIGSVKTNIGHLDAASGIVGLIKTVLALKHQLIPPSLHFHQPNPQIDFENSPFYVNTTLKEWKTNGTPRRAGVSSFGIGGTNAHVILEEAPLREPKTNPDKTPQLLIVSAKTASALEKATANLATHLGAHPELDLGDVAYTLARGRKAFSHRRIVVAQDIPDAVTALTSVDLARGGTPVQNAGDRPVAFMFSGQGTQYVEMARELYDKEPTFKRELDTCCELLYPHLGLDLREILYPRSLSLAEATEQLKQTAVTQPALFAIEYALAQVWIAWGIEPVAAIGHSIGEYVAACIAGVFSLEDALSLVAKRGKLMQEMPPGSMLAVPLSEAELQPLLPADLSLALINGPTNCVVSGAIAAVAAFHQQLSDRGVESRLLHTSHAFHSPMMDPMLAAFTAAVEQVTLNPPKIPYISNVTGTWIAPSEATNPHYWAQHLRQTVRFAQGLETLFKPSDWCLLEVGPGRTLTTFAKRHPAQGGDRLIFPSLRHPQDSQSDLKFLFNTLGQLWTCGVKVNWEQFYTGDHSRLPLPTYPFERQSYWIEPHKSVESFSSRPTLQKQANPANWFYLPSWKRSTLPQHPLNLPPTGSCWLVFLDSDGWGLQMLKGLQEIGQDVIGIKSDTAFAPIDSTFYTLNPADSADYQRLIEHLQTQNKVPSRIVHCWTLTEQPCNLLASDSLETSLNLGFYSLLFLSQALSKHNITEPIQITVLSNHIQSVIGEEILSPDKATLLGPCQVIPQEYPNISCTHIDLVLPEPGSASAQNLLKNLHHELLAKPLSPTVAYRGLHRWVQIFEPIPLEKPTEKPPLLKEKGVYVITGGLGRIGLVFTQYLAETVQGKIALIGRSTFPNPEEWEQWLNTHPPEDSTVQKILLLRKLEALGSEVMVVTADVASLDSMTYAMAQIQDRFGPINGVIHGAGKTGNESFHAISSTTISDCQAQFQPKIQGLLVLDRLFQNHPLDFCLLTSSLSSILGGLGFVAYSAANRFMDAFTHHHTQTNRTPWISINWEGWQLNQSIQPGVPASNTLAELAVTPSEGIEALNRILASGLNSQIVISTGDLSLRLAQWIERQSFQETPENPSLELASSGHDRPQLSTDYQAPESALAQTIASIWEKFLGIERIGIHDDFFDLGGDSLLAVQIVSKLRKTLNVELSPHSLLNAPTIAGLVQVIQPDSSAAKDSLSPALPPLLVKIKSGSLQPPLFLVHPAGGYVYFYRELAQYLEKEQSVYGIQAQGLDGKTPPLNRVEEMASRYLESLRVIQPKGPYFLGGSSFGGTIAFEMAQKLISQGETIALLALLDSPGGQQLDVHLQGDAEVFAYLLNVGTNLSVSSQELQSLPPDQRLGYFLKNGGMARELLPDMDIEQIQPFMDVFQRNIEALKYYNPRPYPGRILFFRASDRDSITPAHPERAWLDLAVGGVEIHEVPGNHITMNFSPHVQAIATQLTIALQDARSL